MSYGMRHPFVMPEVCWHFIIPRPWSVRCFFSVINEWLPRIHSNLPAFGFSFEVIRLEHIVHPRAWSIFLITLKFTWMLPEPLLFAHEPWSSEHDCLELRNCRSPVDAPSRYVILAWTRDDSLLFIIDEVGSIVCSFWPHRELSTSFWMLVNIPPWARILSECDRDVWVVDAFLNKCGIYWSALSKSCSIFVLSHIRIIHPGSRSLRYLCEDLSSWIPELNFLIWNGGSVFLISQLRASRSLLRESFLFREGP